MSYIHLGSCRFSLYLLIIPLWLALCVSQMLLCLVAAGLSTSAVIRKLCNVHTILFDIYIRAKLTMTHIHMQTTIVEKD